jgi:hypothetical protein
MIQLTFKITYHFMIALPQKPLAKQRLTAVLILPRSPRLQIQGDWNRSGSRITVF